MNIDSEILSLMPYFIPKVLVATICGVIIGIDRELKQKVAGVRTFILISVGCAVFSAISVLMSDNQIIDPTRIIGQIITGIGFLGAGVIVKNDDKIVGVTTAAFIWCISAIGVLAGIGAIWTMAKLLSWIHQKISSSSCWVRVLPKNNMLSRPI